MGPRPRGRCWGLCGVPHPVIWAGCSRYDPGTPPAVCSRLLLGLGQQVGLTYHQPGQRAELAWLWGDDNHTGTSQWKITSARCPFLGTETERAWETLGQRAATKYLVCVGHLDPSQPAGGGPLLCRTLTRTVLRLGQGDLKVSPGLCRSWPSRVLGSNCSLLQCLWGLQDYLSSDLAAMDQLQPWSPEVSCLQLGCERTLG